MPRKKFIPIKINTEDPSDIFNTHRLEISKAIINGIDYGIKNNKSKVDFANITIKGILVVTLSIDKREFLDLIEDNLKTLIEFEEYETCALAVKLKKKLDEKVTKKDRVVV
jgi:hypothetical protein